MMNSSSNLRAASQGAPDRLWHTDRLLAVCLALLSCAVVWPFWSVEFLPFLDIPQHLATIGVMHHFDDAAFDHGAYFTVDATSTQYLLYYLGCDLLADLMGVENANRLFISLYAVLLPLSVAYCLGAWGRMRQAALLAFPLVFNKFLFYGFVNYVFAFPFLFFGLGLMRRMLDSLRDDASASVRSYEVLLALCGLLIFFSHLQVYLVYFGALGLVLLLDWPGAKRYVRRMAHLIPSLALFLGWLLRTDGLAGGEAWAETVSKRYESLQGAAWESTWDTVTKFSERLLSVYRDGPDEVITLALGFAILLLITLRGVHSRARTEWAEGRVGALRDFAPEAITLCVFLFYCFTPTSYRWVWPINWRFAPMFVLLLLLWGTDAPHRYVQRGLTVLFAVLAAGSIWVHTTHFAAFDAEAQEITPLLEKMEPGGRAYALMFDTGSKVLDGPAYLHFVQYHQLRRGGVSVYSFAEAPQSPIRFLSRQDGGPPPTPLRSEWKAHEFRFNTDARYYNYFLTRGGNNIARRARFPRGEVKEIASSGSWKLFHYAR